MWRARIELMRQASFHCRIKSASVNIVLILPSSRPMKATVAFWKALELLYRFSREWRPNIDYFKIVLVKKGVRKPTAASKSSHQLGLFIPKNTLHYIL